MNFPGGLFYTKDHEWAQTGSNDVVTVGLSDHAQEALGEIVYAELPQIGRKLKPHETFGVVESIKAVSDCYSPIMGEVVEVNSRLADEPSLINKSPYDEGWLIRVKLTDKGSLKDLMDSKAYTQYVETLK